MKSTLPTPASRGPKATYFPPARIGVGVGGNANFSVRVGGNANFSIFRYQHVGIPSTKVWRWGGPNANGYASQWNIGLRLM